MTDDRTGGVQAADDSFATYPGLRGSMALFLADDSAMCTAQTVIVDGGWDSGHW